MSVAKVMHIIFSEKCEDTNKDAKDRSGMDCDGYKFWDLCSQSDKGKDDNFESLFEEESLNYYFTLQDQDPEEQGFLCCSVKHLHPWLGVIDSTRWCLVDGG